MVHRPTALFAVRPEHLPMFFPPTLMHRLRLVADVDTSLLGRRFDEPEVVAALATTEVLITGWGTPPLDAAFLGSAPRLRAVLHCGGSVKGHVTTACWERGVLVSSAVEANALPVAEYALAAILLAGKGVFGQRESYRAARRFTVAEVVPGVGNYHRSVGIVGASRIGRRVIELLKPHDLEVVVYDPYLDPLSAAELGVRTCGLDELLATCDVVSLHAPDNAETARMLDADRLALMRDGAVLVNTARGGLVDTDALVAELVDGRLSAVLDVTDQEPLPPGSVLFDLPNVFLTPHIAGSHGNELERLGRCVVEEVERLAGGDPLAHLVHHSDLDRVA